jgi:gluconolactonase
MTKLLFRKRLLLALLALPLVSWPSAADDKKAYPAMGSILRKDPAFDKLVPRDAKLEKLADGFKWTEGPVWISDGGFLLFSDIPNNRIVKWQAGKGAHTWLKPSGYTGEKARGGEPGTNGLMLDREGRLILCEHGDRRVTRLDKIDPHAKKTVLADRYQGKRLNSPNDVAVKSNGDIYFTDPPYGLEKNWDDPARELDFCGVYRIGASDGKLTLLTKEMTRPNGIVFSPDEKTLYVANSDPKIAVWMAFDVKTDGTLGKGRVFFDATSWVGTKKGLPDGMKVDQQGNLFATGPGGVHVFTPDGTHLGSIDTGVATANCAFGNDGSVLYVAADTNLCRIKLNTKGKGF